LKKSSEQESGHIIIHIGRYYSVGIGGSISAITAAKQVNMTTGSGCMQTAKIKG
jgi:hypothetical protein